MLRLVAKDFRCFRELDVPVAPLTLLVGENSTGKSTFLALLRLAWDVAFSRGVIDFNAEPFLLGAWDDIARYHGGQGRRAKEFEIGLDVSLNGEGDKKNVTDGVARFRGTFEKVHGHPEIKRRTLRFDDYGIDWSRGENQWEWSIEVTAPHWKQQAKVMGAAGPHFAPPFDIAFQIAGWEVRGGTDDASRKGATEEENNKNWATLRQHFHQARAGALELEPRALAPVRAEPRRHYDPVSDTPKPSGDHVPMQLAKISRENEREWVELIKRLEEFGVESEMFTGLRVVQGKKENEPFRIEVGVRGQRGSRNLVDVGYGVSQLLPILVDALRTDKRWLLMQQPEVHLHPRAQAELGSLFVDLVESGRRFVIETHSDYLVDRVCTEVRKVKGLHGGLTPDKVVILYFEPDESSVKVHPIHVDDQGNLLDAPPGFRAFFLEEQRRFLGL
jgi:predicted ATPase